VIFPFCPSRHYTLSLFRFFSVLALVAASGFSHAAEFAGGSGDSGSPYEIATVEQLNEVRNYLNNSTVHFELTADIDLDGTSWAPIGPEYSDSFRGVLDGNGYAINGLHLNFDRDASDQGLFGYLRDAEVRDLHVTDAQIVTSDHGVNKVGVLAGGAAGSTVSHVYVSGDVEVRGLASNYAGGLIGIVQSSTLSDSGADVRVQGGNFAGGLIGSGTDTVIKRSFALGDVNATYSYVGGLSGDVDNSEIQDSFARGAVTSGGSNIGGLLGYTRNGATVQNSYATGPVTTSATTDTQGGLIGSADGTVADITDSYWDTVTSGQSTSDGGIGSDTDELTDAGTMAASGIFSGWNFDSTWGMDSSLNGGYPVLLWNVAAGATLAIQAPVGNLSEPALPQTFTWNTGTTSNLVSYDFQLARDAGFNDIVLEQSGLATASVDGPVLEKDTEYHWRVRAVVGDSIGQWQTTTFTTPAVVFADGDGSSADPWQIASAEQLDLMREHLSDHFELTADIDLGELAGDWVPIGSESAAFTGELDGNGHTISGLNINSTGISVGLFGEISGGAVRSLFLTDVNVTGSNEVGAFVGKFVNSVAEDVWASGQVSSEGYNVGGLVGRSQDGSKIRRSGADVQVSSTFGRVGGLVGYQFGSGTIIRESFAIGDVSGANDIGGLVGQNYKGALIVDSFARGAVTGDSDVGGLIGEQYFENASTETSFSTGMVSGGSGGAGGLVGGIFASDPNTLDSVWDTATSDMDESAAGEGWITAQMQQSSSYSSNWDFANIWSLDSQVNAGYPYLDIPVSMPGIAVLDSPADQAAVTTADPVFTWAAAISADSYELAIADNESFTTTQTTLNVAGNVTQVDMPSLNADTVYYWRVRAKNAGTVAGEWSSVNAFYTGELAPPALLVTALDPEFVEGDAAVQLFADAAATVRTGQLLQSLTLTVSDLGGAGDEWLVIDGSDVELQDGNSVATADTGLTVAVSVVGSTATVSVTGTSLNSAGMNALVDGIRYRHDGDISANASREITLIELQDDGGAAFADENTTVLALTSVVSVSAPAPAPVTPPVSGNTVGGMVTGATLNGVSTILAGGVLDGGVINGTVNNAGEITGDVTLGASAIISGGVVSGNLSGQPSAPGRIVGATVSAGAQLSHVVIGVGTVLEPGVELGEGVRFSSVQQIPENTELAQTLPQLSWNGDESVSVPDLNASVLASGDRTLASLITDLPDFGAQLSEAGFDSQQGEFSLMLDDGRAALVPVSVQRHDGDEEVRVTAEGHVLFASPEGLRIELVPMLVSADEFEGVLNDEIGLELASDGSVLVAREPGPSTGAAEQETQASAGETVALSVSSEDVPNLYYVVRPGLLAVPAYRHDTPGLHFHAMPGLGNVQGMSQVFESADGTLLEQDIIAVPADWNALSDLLWQLGDDVRDVSINELGLITVEQDAGTLRLRVELMVREGAEPAGGPMRYTFAGDLSGNGVGDYWLIYPNGDRQAIYLY